jgi:hypothetical protein
MIEEQDPFDDEGDDGTESNSQPNDYEGSVEGVNNDRDRGSGTESENEDSDGSLSEV